MSEAHDAPSPPEDPRRRRLMEVAITVFLRFGFRKTSMDEVAQAAGLSRQGLYLHFGTKEELFRASVQHLLDGALAEAAACFANEELPVAGRLVGGFDAWIGRFVGVLGGNAADLAAAASELVGPMVAEREGLFIEAVTRAVRGSGLVAAYKPAGLTARQLADTLYATARGLKYSATREAFLSGMTVAVRAMCLPLRERGARP